MSIRVSIVLDAPRPQVWSELRTIDHHVNWMLDATAIRFKTEQRVGTGTVFECDTKVGPFRLTDVMEITDWNEDSSMAVRHSGAVSGVGRFILTDGAPGTTTLTWEEALRFPWWLGASLGAFLARPVLTALWNGNLRRFKASVPTA